MIYEQQSETQLNICSAKEMPHYAAGCVTERGRAGKMKGMGGRERDSDRKRQKKGERWKEEKQETEGK